MAGSVLLCDRSHRPLILLLIMSLLSSSQTESSDIARGKPTSSKTVYLPYQSWRAVDGDTTKHNYFRSLSFPDQWWRVDLGHLYYIQLIRTQTYFLSYFVDVSILVSPLLNPEDPHPDSPDWTVVLSEGTVIDYKFLAFDPITDGLDHPKAKHIALFSPYRNGLVVNEVEVSGYRVAGEVSNTFSAITTTTPIPTTTTQVPTTTTEVPATITQIPTTTTPIPTTTTQAPTTITPIPTTTAQIPTTTTQIPTTTTQIPTTTTQVPTTTTQVPTTTTQIPTTTTQIHTTSTQIPATATQIPTTTTEVPTTTTQVPTTTTQIPTTSTQIPTTTTQIPTKSTAKPTKPSVFISQTNSSCVNLSWAQWEDWHISHYEYSCTNDQTGQVEAASLRTLICGYLPYTLVRCDVIAWQGGGLITTNSIVHRTNCSEPHLPADISHFLSQETYSDDVTGDKMYKIKLDISQMNITLNCESLQFLGYKLSTDQLYIENSEYMYNLAAGAHYILNIKAVNNEGLVASKNLSILTEELAPAGSPLLDLKFNGSCATLTLSPVSKPNGIITHYQYECGYTRDTHKTTTAGETAQDHVVVCGLPSATKFKCSATAFNSAGESQSASSSGFTSPKITSGLDVQVMTQGYGELVMLELQPIKLEKGQLRKYRIVVDKGAHRKRTKRDFSLASETCDLNRLYSHSRSIEEGLTCYIAAEINVTDTENGRLSFSLGDGKMYGGYENVALVPGLEYIVQVAVAALVEEENSSVELFAYLPKLSITVPTVPTCDTPPLVSDGYSTGGREKNGAEWELGLLVDYSCDVGYTRTQGESLRCELKDGTPEWVGEVTKCEKQATEFPGVTVGLATSMGVLGFIFLVILFIKLYKGRKSPGSQASSQSRVKTKNTALPPTPDDDIVYEDLDQLGSSSTEYLKPVTIRSSSKCYDVISDGEPSRLEVRDDGKRQTNLYYTDIELSRMKSEYESTYEDMVGEAPVQKQTTITENQLV